MSRFNSKLPSSKTINKAGGIAYKHSPEMELILASLNTFLEDKFYESGDERMDRISDLVSKCKPEFVAKLAVVAREDFHLRSVTHLLVSLLSKIHRGDNLVSRTLYRIAQRPDDLTEILAVLGKPIPKQIKLGMQKALTKFDAYQLAKYRGEGKEVKLVDVFNLVHPYTDDETLKQV
jgi:60 kDa SS-A/Ro ribonucleoprotein